MACDGSECRGGTLLLLLLLELVLLLNTRGHTLPFKSADCATASLK